MERELLAAAGRGDKLALKRALTSPNIDVNTVDQTGQTALFLAAREGKDDMVQLLLDAGANLNLATTRDGDTPLIVACSEGRQKVAQKLIAAGGMVNGPNVGGWTPLIYAAYYGHKSIVELLLANNANINQTSQTGCSALYRACTANRPEMVQLLLEAGADVNLATKDGRTPLAVASWYGYTDIVKILLEAGADVDTFSTTGATPLHEALENEHYDVIELLLTLGQADPTLPDGEGRVPLMSARSERAMGLLQTAIQAKQIRDNLRALQAAQPQLTQLTHTVKTGAENSYTVAMDASAVLDLLESSDAAPALALTPPDTITTAALSDGGPAAAAAEETGAADDGTAAEDTSSTRRYSARRSAQLSNKVLSALNSLAQASPLTIDCLKQFGASAVQAEQEYARIRKDPTMYEYYLFFIQAVSSAVLACQTIASGFVDDTRLSTAEQVMKGIDTAAQAVSWMGAPLVTGIGKFLVTIPHQMERQRTIRRITTYFPSVDSHKYIEILAREATILLCKDIHAVFRETKRQSKQSILTKVMRVVEWLQTATNLTVVQGMACGHAAKLVDVMMRQEVPFVVEYTHMPVLLEWCTGLSREEIAIRRTATPTSPLSPASILAAGYSPNPTADGAPNTTDAAAAAEEPSGRTTTPLTPCSAFAERDEVDERIFKLQRQLSQEQHQREAVELQHRKDINALKKQMKGLEAVNQIFSGASTGGLVNAQSAEELHKTIGEHLSQQAHVQAQQNEAIRELALRLELLAEDNNLRTPVKVEVSGGSGGSGVYTPDKGDKMGEWVNGKTSRTADSPPPPPIVQPARSQQFDAASGRSNGSGANQNGSMGIPSGDRRSFDADGIDAEGSNVAIDTGGCCVIS